MFMDVRFFTIIFVGLHIAEESDDKPLITVLKKMSGEIKIVINITQKWSRDCVFILTYTYITCTHARQILLTVRNAFNLILLVLV